MTVLDRPRVRPRVAQQQQQPVAVSRSRGTPLRLLGALALLAVGAVHLEQWLGVHFRVVPTIGPLFLLNFIGSTAVALGLLLPLGRLHVPLALGGVAIGVTSIVFLLLSEHGGIFGFEDYGYRPAIVIALAAEAVTAVLLTGWLAVRRPRGG